MKHTEVVYLFAVMQIPTGSTSSTEKGQAITAAGVQYTSLTAGGGSSLSQKVLTLAKQRQKQIDV